MELILREDVPDLGIIGDIVNVRPGYARNFLLPRGLAVPANRRNVKQLEHEQAVIELKKQRERGTYERLAEQLKQLKLSTEVRAGRKGKLFGSVTNMDVHALLVEQGFDIDRRRIEIKEPIKLIGDFMISIRVGQDIDAEVPLKVAPLGGELEDLAVDEEDETPSEPAPLEAAEGAESEADSDSSDGDESVEADAASSAEDGSTDSDSDEKSD